VGRQYRGCTFPEMSYVSNQRFDQGPALERWSGKAHPMLKLVYDNGDANHQPLEGSGRSLLDEIVRDGARQMLASALQAEVAAYVDAHGEHVDDDRSEEHTSELQSRSLHAALPI